MVNFFPAITVLSIFKIIFPTIDAGRRLLQSWPWVQRLKWPPRVPGHVINM